jgi:hypothetical protein
MISPIKEYRVGLLYGARVPYYPFWHPGIDLLPYAGSDRTVYVPHNGVVAAKFYHFGAGNCVDINLDNGLAVRLCHMVNPANVKVGQRVAQGLAIGIMGATGIYIYPRGYVHMHYVVFTNHKRNVTTNPAPYLTSHPTPADLDAQVAPLFALIWHRLPAAGEIKYFQKRMAQGSIVGRDDLIAKITYTYDIYTAMEKKKKGTGEDWWQKEKNKVLLG